jgi:preprotein translocase subunit SecA
MIAGMHPELSRSITLEKIKGFVDAEEMQGFISGALVAFYEERCKESDPVAVAQAERVITLRSLDTHWMDHIDDMAHLREQVAFAGYAQRDPLIEYKDQAFRRFQQLLVMMESTIVRTLLQVDFRQFQPRVLLQQADEELASIRTNEDQIEAELEETGVGSGGSGVRSREMGSGDILSARLGPSQKRPIQAVRHSAEAGRNDPCPCGSGKKYKKCHGK